MVSDRVNTLSWTFMVSQLFMLICYVTLIAISKYGKCCRCCRRSGRVPTTRVPVEVHCALVSVVLTLLLSLLVQTLRYWEILPPFDSSSNFRSQMIATLVAIGVNTLTVVIMWCVCHVLQRCQNAHTYEDESSTVASTVVDEDDLEVGDGSGKSIKPRTADISDTDDSSLSEEQSSTPT